MGKSKKKAQNAASRKDVFYKRAKEQGYRARSAFKLIHLNNLHGFLKKAKVCLDLCAAPGSWMQVAREYMPSGSVIVGVDIDSIKPIPNTISIKGDITTDSVRSELRTTLKQFKADVVLHDGAPNVGKNWSQDAYEQNLLVLHSFKLACEFLKYGGDFITKVFRSKDSTSLEFVFKALFKTVESTKPQASRYESAEIFYVCRHFKLRADDKADPKFFDPKEVFKEVEATLPSRINLQHPEKVSRKVMGYEDGVEILYKETTVTDFVESDHHEELLQQTSALTLDSPRWAEHPSITEEIRCCCQDIKVLGRKELRLLLNWRKKLREEIDAEKKVIEDAIVAQETVPKTPEEEEKEEMDKVQQQIDELNTAAVRENKKQERAVRKQKRVLQQKLKLMSMSGDPVAPRDDDFFSLQLMEKVKDPDAVVDQYDASDSDGEKEERPKYMRYRRDEYELDDSGKNYRHVDDLSDTDSDGELPQAGDAMFKKRRKTTLKKVDGIEIVPKENQAEKHKKAVRFAAGTASDSDDSANNSDGTDSEEEDGDKEDVMSDSGVGEDEDDDVATTLTTDLVGDVSQDKKERTAESWFSQDIFNELESDADEDLEVDAAVSMYKRIGGKVLGEEDDDSEKVPAEAEEVAAPKAPQSYKLSRENVQQQLDQLLLVKQYIALHKGSVPSPPPLPATPHTEVVVPDMNTVDTAAWDSSMLAPRTAKRDPDMTAVELALAAKLIQTKKAKRDLELQGWNRYMKGEEPGLPQWFVDDETQNCTAVLDVEEETVSYYTAREKLVNARTLKKVMEAKVRKQRRFKKTMQNVLKKTEALQGSSLLTEFDKQQEIKSLYKKAMKTREKKDTTYLVMSKKHKGQKPKGVKGKTKMVDRRLKSDVRAKIKLGKKKKTFGRSKGKKH